MRTDDEKFGTKFFRLGYRHRRFNAERFGAFAFRKDDPVSVFLASANGDRLPLKFGIYRRFDAGKKVVEIGMQDRSLARAATAASVHVVKIFFSVRHKTFPQKDRIIDL